jgi:hypothetical protein
MESTLMNGRKRPTLSEQIERLDSILDGLADNLNEAVADAVKTAVAAAVQETVQVVLQEVLSNPAIRAGLLQSRTPPAPAAPARTGRRRLGAWLGQAWKGCCSGVRSLRRRCRAGLAALGQVCVDGGQRVGNWVRGGVGRVRMVLSWWRPLLFAGFIGMALGIAAVTAGPWLTALSSGLAGFTTAIAVQAGWWLRQTLHAILATQAVPERGSQPASE